MLRGVSLYGWNGTTVGANASINASGWTTGNLNCFLENVLCSGAVTGTLCRLQRAQECVFTKLITIATYSQITDCDIQAGMTWTIAPADFPPLGLKGCKLTGTFTGNTGINLLLDGQSNRSLIENNCTLGSNTTVYLTEIAFLERLVVTSNAYVITAATNTASFYLVTPTATATITLPAINGLTYGRTYSITNNSSFTLTVTAAGTDHIWDTSTTSVAITGPYAFIKLTAGDVSSAIWYPA